MIYGERSGESRSVSFCAVPVRAGLAVGLKRGFARSRAVLRGENWDKVERVTRQAVHASGQEERPRPEGARPSLSLASCDPGLGQLP